MLLCGLNSKGPLNKTEELFLQIDQISLSLSKMTQIYIPLMLDRASNAKCVVDLVDSSYPGTHTGTQTMCFSEPSGK